MSDWNSKFTDLPAAIDQLPDQIDVKVIEIGLSVDRLDE